MSRLLALLAAPAIALASTPAQAQYYRYDRYYHHDDDDVDEVAAAVVGGVVGLITGYAIGSGGYYGYYGRGYYGRPGYGYPAYGYAVPPYPYPPPPPVYGYGYGYYGRPYGYYGGYRPYRRIYVAPYAYRRLYYRRY